jgi:thiamine biosynthesis protein ThiI
LANEWLRTGAKFAVRTRRVGTHPYTSQSLAEELGSAILSLDKDLSVDLDAPDVEIFVEVRHDKAYIFKDSVKGPGGLPLGSQGLVLAFMENRNDIAAAWLMMKRGCKVDLAYSRKDGDFNILEAWDPKLRTRNCPDLSSLFALSEKTDADGIVLGWDLERTISNKMKQKIPIFYPLVGLDARQIEGLNELIFSLENHADK